jgi:uncharacterized protein YndB with AHSA1/START domain
MKADIDATVTYPHPVDRVWAALTSSEALAAWFMPNDFKPVVGHRFTFRTRPARAMGFDGIVRCEVLELAPPRRMVWSWAGGNIDTTVTFTLEESAGGTRLRMHQVGFDGLGAQLTRRILASGYPRILGQRLPARPRSMRRGLAFLSRPRPPLAATRPVAAALAPPRRTRRAKNR